MRLDFLIQRRGVDPTAESALHALRDLMHAPIEAVDHGTLWRFEVGADVEAPRLQAELERAACRAGRYVNTNRDTWAWLDSHAAEPQAAREGCSVALWITEGDGRDAVARRYFESRVSATLSAVQRGTFYRLWTRERDAVRARALVTEVAVTRTRTHGLLVNPHTERLEILAVTPALDAAEAP